MTIKGYESDDGSTKVCMYCHVEKPIVEYWKDPSRTDGFNDRCRECFREYDKARHRKNLVASRARKLKTSKTMEIKYPEKRRARQKARYALTTGKLKPTPCEVCGATENIQMHHSDYSKALEVNWVCRVHHIEKYHRRNQYFNYDEVQVMLDLQRKKDREAVVEMVEGIVCKECRDMLHSDNALQRPTEETGTMESLGESTQK